MRATVPTNKKASLRFDDRDTLVGEADSGLIAVVPGKVAESELLRRIQADEESGERMPPEGKPVTASEIELLTRWIAERCGVRGALGVSAGSPAHRAGTYAIPSWPRQAIDRFTLSKLEAAGLKPVGPAACGGLDPPCLRGCDGLASGTGDRGRADAAIGPKRPTSGWSSDCWPPRPSANAGHESGWMWCATPKTNSFERDGAKPNAWKYRDYVIRAMNSDKPYNQFMREQIAGDELETVTPDSLTATGYYRLGLWDDEPADPLQAIFDGYDDLVTTTSQGFLGLTLNCARCHDHKIDPLTQKDYYAHGGLHARRDALCDVAAIKAQ